MIGLWILYGLASWAVVGVVVLCVLVLVTHT